MELKNKATRAIWKPPRPRETSKIWTHLTKSNKVIDLQYLRKLTTRSMDRHSKRERSLLKTKMDSPLISKLIQMLKQAINSWLLARRTHPYSKCKKRVGLNQSNTLHRNPPPVIPPNRAFCNLIWTRILIKQVQERAWSSKEMKIT